MQTSVELISMFLRRGGKYNPHPEHKGSERNPKLIGPSCDGKREALLQII